MKMPPPPPPPLKLLLQLFLILVVLSSSSAAASPSSTNVVSFNFPSFTSSPTVVRNLTLLGDAYLSMGIIGLTSDGGSGSIIYTNPISFRDPESNTTASFSTTFTFSITNAHPASFGDGFTFFLSPDNNKTLGGPSFLGLLDPSPQQPACNTHRFVAVEFDTRMDPRFSDPNDNHVGLDINGLNSIQTTDLILHGIDLKSGDSITAWIDYNNDLATLLVYLSYSSLLKPQRPLLTVNIDLSHHLTGLLYPGFSASALASTELHLIHSWTFQTFGFLPARPGSHPHSVSDIVRPPPISVTGSGSGRHHHKNLRVGVGITAPAIFCTALMVFGYMSVRKWRDIKMEKSFKAELVKGPREFSYKELKKATGGFRSSSIVGTGSFGTVYKAVLSSGSMAAVKRSKHSSKEGRCEFVAELSVIACLRHKNLVQLQGWCVEKGELLLVYDFMRNGSLDKMLYCCCRDEEEEESSSWPAVLSWRQRQKIATGLASVLTYLHQECEHQVIHRDIKTSNIMLDSDFNARLGDFGLARMMARGESPVSTLTAGTMGYLAPEYLQYGKVTEKTDVFSYGVVILEVACGRRPIERELGRNNKMVNLVDWVWGLHSEGRIIEAADKRLKGEFEEDEMCRMLLLGLSCANPDSDARPSMRKVHEALVNDNNPNPLPPKAKPTLSFTSTLPMPLEQIIADY